MQIHLVAILELLMLAGVGFGMGEGGVKDWSRAVDEACTKRINYFNDRPFWRVSKRPVRSIEVTGYRLRQYLKNMPYFTFFLIHVYFLLKLL